MITSTQNPTIKDLLKLSKAHSRRDEALFIIEGYRELKKAVDSGFSISQVFYCTNLQNDSVRSFSENLSADSKTEVSEHVFSRIAYRDNHDGLIATARPRYLTFGDMKPSHRPLFLVIETVEKPGNLGAILRTADGAGADAVIVCDNQTDLYNPNVIRASLGCIFTTTVIQTSTQDAISYFKNQGIAIFSAALQESQAVL